MDSIKDMPYTETDTDTFSALWTAIGKLDPIEKSIVLLYLDELSYKEISEITGLTETNIGVKLNRVKNKIRELIHKYGT